MNDWWLGIEGIREYSCGTLEPVLEINGAYANLLDVEPFFWDRYEQECDEWKGFDEFIKAHEEEVLEYVRDVAKKPTGEELAKAEEYAEHTPWHQ